MAPRREVPREHRTLERRPPWETAGTCRIQEHVVVTGDPAAAVEPVALAEADCQRVEPDTPVEEDVDPADDALAERHAIWRQLVALDHAEPLETAQPGVDVLAVQRKDGHEVLSDEVT